MRCKQNNFLNTRWEYQHHAHCRLEGLVFPSFCSMPELPIVTKMAVLHQPDAYRKFKDAFANAYHICIDPLLQVRNWIAERRLNCQLTLIQCFWFLQLFVCDCIRCIWLPSRSYLPGHPENVKLLLAVPRVEKWMRNQRSILIPKGRRKQSFSSPYIFAYGLFGPRSCTKHFGIRPSIQYRFPLALKLRITLAFLNASPNPGICVLVISMFVIAIISR